MQLIAIESPGQSLPPRPVVDLTVAPPLDIWARVRFRPSGFLTSSASLGDELAGNVGVVHLHRILSTRRQSHPECLSFWLHWSPISVWNRGNCWDAECDSRPVPYAKLGRSGRCTITRAADSGVRSTTPPKCYNDISSTSSFVSGLQPDNHYTMLQ